MIAALNKRVLTGRRNACIVTLALRIDSAMTEAKNCIGVAKLVNQSQRSMFLCGNYVVKPQQIWKNWKKVDKEEEAHQLTIAATSKSNVAKERPSKISFRDNEEESDANAEMTSDGNNAIAVQTQHK